VGKPAIDRTNSFGRLVRYAPFIVVLFHRPWRRLMDMNRIMFHVKFEVGLPISVLRNKATLYEKIGLQNR
jgi:hypothetical protein